MIIFLDIDGVLVPAAGWKTPELLEDGFPKFTEKSVQALQRLIVSTTTIVLSSSHRDRFSLDVWMKIFENRGVTVKTFDRLSSVPNSKRNRKDELLAWFTTHAIHEAFVIIDDDTTLNGLPDYFKQHLVLTSPLIGLTLDHIPQVEAILGKPLALSI